MVAAASVGWGQEQDLRLPPPPIAFEPWKQVEADERTVEFEATFPSAVTTAYPVNNVVPLRVMVPAQAEGPIPVVIVLHYWGALDLRVERSIGFELNSRGIGAVLISLPYHLGRTPQGSRSGAMAIQPDPKKLIATMRQCVLDIRRTVDWIEQRPEFDRNRIGLVGTSLGAIVAALVSGVESRIEAASYVLGGIDIAHVLWRSSRVVNEREKLRGQGYTEERLRQELLPIEPEGYLRQHKPNHAFAVVARYDTVVPPESGRKLIEVLGNASELWLDTGHYGGFFVQKRVHHEVGLFFDKVFRGLAYTPPGRISAPTIRLGVSLYPGRGLQVTAGLDVWRSNAFGDIFANVQIAPRGPQVFVGKRLDRGLAIGVFGRSGGLAPGVYWSIVL
jgi:hypothetical protein